MFLLPFLLYFHYRPGGAFIPSEETPYHLVDGVPFDKLPRVYIKATHQNTIISVRDFKLGNVLKMKTQNLFLSPYIVIERFVVILK